MDQKQQDDGTIAVMMQRMEQFRLPRARRLLEKVQRGEPVDDYDMVFLNRALKDSHGLKPLVERNPGYLSIVSGMIDLYSEIIKRAQENEQAP